MGAEPGVEEGAQGRSYLRLQYREDDASFKRRINTVIQLSWVYNLSLTILAVVVIFYILDLNLFMGLVVGILIGLLSNFHLTLSQVANASHWEVYKNSAIVPVGIRGTARDIQFSQIEALERDKTAVRDLLVVRLASGETIRLDASGQEKPVEAFERSYRQYRHLRSREHMDISLPVSADGD